MKRYISTIIAALAVLMAITMTNRRPPCKSATWVPIAAKQEKSWEEQRSAKEKQKMLMIMKMINCSYLPPIKQVP